MEQIVIYVLIGFVAQLVDGALGMAYGVVSTSILLAFGIPPATASACVHTSEVATTAASGLAHFRFGNVDRTLVRRLILPGVIGAVAGALVLSYVPARTIKPFVAVYLLLMGILILRKAFRNAAQVKNPSSVEALGMGGGFLDAVGGGGWGPVVVSTLVARGGHPRFSIGSVNLAEFFVAAAASATFLITIGLTHWKIIAGLAVGGILAAPVAAYACKKIPARGLMIMVGILIVVLSLRTLVQTLAQ